MRTNMIYELEIEGKIVGKERPRVNLNNGRVYTPNKTKDYENYIRDCFCLTYPNFKQIEGRVSIEIVAFRAIPKNSSKVMTQKMLDDEISPVVKPDIDNIGKVVLDALNKFAFKDDNQVCKFAIQKKYSLQEKIYIKVEEY